MVNWEQLIFLAHILSLMSVFSKSFFPCNENKPQVTHRGKPQPKIGTTDFTDFTD
jgi:hypothetical protein